LIASRGLFIISGKMGEKQQEEDKKTKSKQCIDIDFNVVKTYAVVDNSRFLDFQKHVREDQERQQHFSGCVLASLAEVQYKVDSINRKFEALIELVASSADEFDRFMKQKEDEMKNPQGKSVASEATYPPGPPTRPTTPNLRSSGAFGLWRDLKSLEEEVPRFPDGWGENESKNI
jgi:hypothetical protein